MATTDVRTMTGADLIGRALAAEGVRHLFNLPGNSVYPMLDPLADHPISYILALHEGSLISMADGYARASGKPAFANVYMVPGTGNAIASLYAAWVDNSPLVMTATQQQRALVGRDAYASSPEILSVVRPFTKWAFEVNQPERLPEAIHRAFKIAATPPQGPVFLSLPVDLFRASPSGPLQGPARPSPAPRFGPPPDAVIEEMARHLAEAERILIVLGRDVKLCAATDRATDLADMVGAAVCSEPWAGQTAFPTQHELYFGEYDRDVLDLVRPTVVLGVGARLFPEGIVPDADLPEDVVVLQLGLDPQQIGRINPAQVSAVCDVGLGLERLLERLRGSVQPGLAATRGAMVRGLHRDRRAADERELAERWDWRPMSVARVATELNRVIDARTIVLEQATTASGQLLTYLDLPNPMNVFGSGGSVQGWGVAASIGIKLARPESPVVAIVGDGGLTFDCQALWTAGHYGISVTWVVLQNHGYRSMRGGVSRQAPRAWNAGVDFGYDFTIDIASLGRAFGVQATRVEDPGLLAEAVRGAMESRAPHIVEAVISPGMEFKPSRRTPNAL